MSLIKSLEGVKPENLLSVAPILVNMDRTRAWWLVEVASRSTKRWERRSRGDIPRGVLAQAWKGAAQEQVHLEHC